jgi:hypothetical protein
MILHVHIPLPKEVLVRWPEQILIRIPLSRPDGMQRKCKVIEVLYLPPRGMVCIPDLSYFQCVLYSNIGLSTRYAPPEILRYRYYTIARYTA